MGPLELMYSWQALACAAASVGVTRLVKTIIGLVYLQRERKRAMKGPGPYRTAEVKEAAKEARQANVWVTRVALPLTAIVTGAVYALLVPLRPEVLIEYVSEHLSGFWVYMAYLGWGGACGQFSTALHEKLKSFLKEAKPA